MKVIKYGTAVLTTIIILFAYSACNNFFHELIPSDDNQITEFELQGQIEGSDINNNDNLINVPWNETMYLKEMQVIRLSLPAKASILPVTQEYIQAAFPGIKNYDEVIKKLEETEAENLTACLTELIKQNPDFNVPALDKPIDFSRPVTLLVISGHGSVRRYTVNMVIYVLFESNGGSEIDVQGVVYGTAISEPHPSPSKTGYTFNGWYGDNNTFANLWDFDTTITENVTLYAKWEPVTYTVRYDKNADDATGTTADSIHTYDVDQALTSNGYTRENYPFAAWNTKPDGSGTGYSNGQIVKNLSAEDGAIVTLYVRWNNGNQSTVTFDSNGGSYVSPATGVNKGETISKPADPVKDGYTFSGWYRDNNTFTQPWNFSTDTVTGDITLYAKWNYVDINVNVVIFNSNGGSYVSPATGVNKGDKVLKPADPVRPGYTFNGWYKDNNLSQSWNFNTDTITETITNLYAKWSINTYTVTYYPDGGSPAPSPLTQTMNYGSTISQPAAMTRTGYTFGGWFTNADKTTPASFPITVTGNVSLYAMWIINTYTVIFNTNGGEPTTETKTVEYGEKILPKPSNPGITGFVFIGWFNKGIEWNFDNDTVTGDITLEAMYIRQ